MSTTSAVQPDPPTPDPRAEVVPPPGAPGVPADETPTAETPAAEAPVTGAPLPAAQAAPAPKRRRAKAAVEAPPAEPAAAAADAPAALPAAETPEAAPAPEPAPRERSGRPAAEPAASALPEATGEPTDLQRALREAIAARGLDLAAAAAAIGVAAPGLRRVLSGASRPNARTLGAYARWLGVAEASLVPAKAKPKAEQAARPARPAIDVKAGFRALRELLAAASAEPEVVEAEIDPELAALAADKLAWQVHRAPAAARKVVAAALATLVR